MSDYTRMIEVAAYYRAERRGFLPGHEVEDWLAAEGEVCAMLVAEAKPARPKKPRARRAAGKGRLASAAKPRAREKTERTASGH